MGETWRFDSGMYTRAAGPHRLRVFIDAWSCTCGARDGIAHEGGTGRVWLARIEVLTRAAADTHALTHLQQEPPRG